MLSGAYGLGMLFATNKVLESYDLPPADPASAISGAFQYLGGFEIMWTLRCIATIQGNRDIDQTLEWARALGSHAHGASLLHATPSLRHHTTSAIAPSDKSLIPASVMCAGLSRG